MSFNRRTLLFSLGIVVSAILIYLCRIQVALLGRLLLGSAIVAYLFFPLAQWFEKKFHMSRVLSIACALLSALSTLILIIVLFVPPLIGQMRELIAMLPTFAESIKRQLRALNTLLNERGFSRITLPELEWERVLSTLPPLLGGTASFAGSLFNRLTEWTLIFILGYYLLRDRERLMLHLELLVPSIFRRTALTMTSAVHREIGTFLRGQLLISLIVGALSAIVLMLTGVKSFLALGLIIGLFNMIPYFGPLLGAIPAVLMALTQGVFTAVLTAVGLFVVQQLDSIVISPRIMGALTGLHPASVLLAIIIGSSFSGIVGMLLAIPLTLAIRAVSRVWMAREIAN